MLATILKEIDRLKEEVDDYRLINQYQSAQDKEYFRIGLTYSSNALEGNTLTETETKIVLEEGITIGGKPLKDHFEAVGHSQAYDFLYSLLLHKGFCQEHLKQLHYLFYYRINQEVAGNYRTVPAFITGSKYPLPKPDQLSSLMSDFIETSERLIKNEHPVVAAAQIHKEFVYIHPFVDGNGRVARLLMNLVLLQQGFMIVCIPPIMRAEYIQTLEVGRSNDASFILLIAQMVKEGQKEYLRLFR
jgi:Fic family protein